MFKRRQVSRVFFLWLTSIIVAGSHGARADDPQVGTREYARQKGPALLREQDWEAAAQAYATWDHDLEQAVSLAWQRLEDETAGQLEKRRAMLLDFYLKTMNFSVLGWRSSAPKLASRLEQYQELASALPDGFAALDCSRIDVLQSLCQTLKRGNLSTADRDRALAALREHPSSVPAFACLVIVLSEQPRDRLLQWTLLQWSQVESLAATDWHRLTLAREAAVKYSISADVQTRIIEAAVPLTPSDAEKAMLLYRLAVGQRGTQRQVSSEVAQRVLGTCRKIFERFPTARFASEARHFAVATLAKAGHRDDALALVRQLQAQGDPQRPGLDRALFALSTSYFEEEQFDHSESLLQEILEKYPGSATASRAMLGLAEVYAARNDPEQERRWLLECAQFELTDPTQRGLMDTDNTRSVAHQRLAEDFESRGQWAEALKWWTSWQPQSWCGTCAGQMAASKAYHRARCQLQRNQHAAAAKICLEAIEKHVADWSPDSTLLLFEMYRRAGQLDDLVKLVGAHQPQDDDGWQYTAAGRIYRWNQVAEMERRGAVAELIRVCRESENTNPRSLFHPDRAARSKLAAEALARMGGKAVRAIRKELEQQEDLYTSTWLLYALGHSKSPDAFETLKRIKQRETPCHLDHLVTAISLHGEKGKQVLEQLTEHTNSHYVRSARDRLEQMETEGVSRTAWPDPPRGVLPNSPNEQTERKPGGAASAETRDASFRSAASNAWSTTTRVPAVRLVLIILSTLLGIAIVFGIVKVKKR